MPQPRHEQKMRHRKAICVTGSIDDCLAHGIYSLLKSNICKELLMRTAFRSVVLFSFLTLGVATFSGGLLGCSGTPPIEETPSQTPGETGTPASVTDTPSDGTPTPGDGTSTATPGHGTATPEPEVTPTPPLITPTPDPNATPTATPAAPTPTPTHTPSPGDEDGDGVKVPTDCNDADATIYPGAPELCDSKDNDCDGAIDDGASKTWYYDQDGDGYGVASSSVATCTQPIGYAARSGDCDDKDASVNPGHQSLAMPKTMTAIVSSTKI